MNKILTIAIMIILIACANHKQTANSESMANEPFLIYKTKADYSNLVPVILNNEKTAIVSYPAPSDIFKNGELALPTPLNNGYLIDNRGIGLSVAFTSFTYAEYTALNSAPSIDQLMESIVDKDPLLELYNCKEFLNIKHDIKKANKLVKNNFKGCIRML
jgi:hypothetical protein